MSDVTNSTATPAAAATPKTKSIMDLRTPIFFATVAEASNYLNKIASEKLESGEANPDYCPDFESAPLVLNGVDAEGNFDSNIYTADTEVMFHVLTNRGKVSQDAQGKEIKSPATIRAIIVTPTPKQSAVEADKTGADWLTRIFRTQITKAACDPIRTAENVHVASKDMPLTLADFVTTSRESSSIMESFDKLFRPILDLFKEKSPAWARARLNKGEFKKALESREYALAVYPNLEDRGDKPSMFVMAATFALKECKNQSLDPQIWQTWLDTRDETKMTQAETTEEAGDELDSLDSLEGLSLASDEPATEEAAPAATPAADPAPAPAA